MENLPSYISTVFILTTFLSIYFFYKASNNSLIVLLSLLAWITLQAAIGLTGFYTNTMAIPPRFLLLLGPALISILLLFVIPKGKIFLAHLDQKTLTLLHIVRVPVEMVLFWLAAYKTVPELMTFEGRNFDILSGLTAPIVYYLGYHKTVLSKNVLLLWNLICLGLLLNIVIHAILSAPFPFQQLAFDQPNIAVFHFPFLWLPGLVVPLVLLSHLASIRQLLSKK